MARALLISLILFLAIGPAQAGQQAPLDKTGHYYCEAGTVQGGEITDGRDLRAIRWGKHPDWERIVLDIYKGAYQEKGPAAAVPCHFQVRYEYYPFRLIITLQGIRARHAEFTEFNWSELIRETYQLPFLDDSGLQFAIALEGAVKYEVFELHDPARIVIDLRPYPPREELPPVYAVRTASGIGFEELDYYKEIARGAGSGNPRIIKAGDGQLFFEEGHYADAAQARARMETITAYFPQVFFFIEPRGPAAIPRPAE